MDTVIARGTFDLGALGSIGFEDQYYVLTATHEQMLLGQRTLSSPYDAVFGLDGTANVYDLNDVTIMPSTGQTTLGEHGYVRKVITDQAGAFEDFAMFKGPASDPVDGVLLDSTAGASSGNVGAPWQRHWLSFLPSKKASFLALGARFNDVPSSGVQHLDAAMAEINPEGDAPTEYASARNLHPFVRPTRLNYSANPNFASSLKDWSATEGTQKNLVLNPSGEKTSGTTTVATNLCTHPNMEASSGLGVMESNLILNPNMIATSGTVDVTTNSILNPTARVDTTNVQGYAGGETITRVTPSNTTGLPAGVTTAYQVNCTTGTGISLASGTLTTGGTYVVSLYARLISGTATGWAPAMASVTAGTAVTLTSSWQRVSVSSVINFTSVNAGIRNNAANTGAVIEVAAVLLERNTVPSPYFDGATAASGDFTYLWAGTANASASRRQAAALANVSNNTAEGGAVYQTTANAEDGSACAVRAGSGYALAKFSGFTGIDIGETYTVFARVKTPYSTIRLIERTSGYVFQDIVTTPNVWTDVRITRTRTQTDPFQLDLGYEASNIADGAEFYIDKMLVVEGYYTGPFFDGSTPASGDYSHTWDGLANSSISRRRAPSVTGWFQPEAIYSMLHQTSQEAYLGTNSARVEVLATGGLSSFHSYGLQQSVTASSTDKVCSVWLKASAGALIGLRVTRIDAGGAKWGDVNGDKNATATATGAWQRVSLAMPAYTGATSMQIRVGFFGTTGTFSVGNVLYADAVQLEGGTTPSPYFDGTTADTTDLTYDWTGTVDASTSTKKAAFLTDWWASSSVSGALVAYQITGGVKGSKAIEVQHNGSDTSWAIVYGTIDAIPILSGRTYTMSFYGRLIEGTIGVVNTRCAESDGVPNLSGDKSHTLTTDWQRFTHTFTANQDATSVTRFYLNLANDVAFRYQFDALMLEEADLPSAYFDGDMDGVVWEGTAHASTSTVETEFTRSPGALVAAGSVPLTHAVSGLIPGREYVGSVRVSETDQFTDIIPTVEGAETVSDGWFGDRRWARFIANASTHILTLSPVRNGDTPRFTLSEVLIEAGTAPRPYFDGGSGDDYLWEQGGTPGEARSYFYEDRDERHYILVRTLKENVPVGVSVSDPEYAVGPPTS